MALLTWDEKYSLNIVELDRQHRRLFALFNDLYEAMQDGHGADVIDKVLTGMIDYTAYHFAYEEKLLRENGYKDTAAHRAEHARLAQQAKDLAVRARDGDVTPATLKFLSGWLLNHILVEDRKFAGCLAGGA